MTRDQLYLAGLKKLQLSERPNRQEARELRRRRLEDGSYPFMPDFVARNLRRRQAAMRQ